MNKIFLTLSIICISILSFSLSSCMGCVNSLFEDEEKADTANMAGLEEIFKDAVCGTDMDEEGTLEFYGLDTYTDDEDGQEYPIAYFSYNGVVFEIIDADLDGVFDTAICDLNEDDDIADNEMFDITEENIKVSDLQEEPTQTYCRPSRNSNDAACEEADEEEYDDYTPAREQREEEAEQDLPDYVNNANVKGILKKK